MKKFMFSAIAMIAFVGSSMANNRVEKEVENSSKLETKLNSVETSERVLIFNECFYAAMFMMDRVEFENGEITDIVEFNAFYQYYISMCERGALKL